MLKQISTLELLNLGQRRGAYLMKINNKSNTCCDLLEKEYPHLYTKIVDLTYNWALAGKYILNNAVILRDYLDTSKELVTFIKNKSQVPFPLPYNITLDDYKDHMNLLFIYLENEVLPVLEKIFPVPIEVEDNLNIESEVYCIPEKQPEILISLGDLFQDVLEEENE